MDHTEDNRTYRRALIALSLGALLALTGCVRSISPPPRMVARNVSSEFELPLLAIEAAGRTVCALGYAERVQCARVDRTPRVVYDVPGTEDAVELAVTTRRGCVVTGAGEVRCFAFDEGVTGEARRVHGIEDVAEVALADELACARTYGGEVACWSGSHAPRLVRGLDATRSIAAVDSTACALASDGRVACWGVELEPTPVPGVEAAIALGAGADGAFAVAADGAVLLFHHFGRGAYMPATEIARVPGATDVAIGHRGGCVQDSDGTARCWQGESWELWRERSLDGATSIAVGEGFACAVREDGHLRCRASGDAPARIARGMGH